MYNNKAKLSLEEDLKNVNLGSTIKVSSDSMNNLRGQISAFNEVTSNISNTFSTTPNLPTGFTIVSHEPPNTTITCDKSHSIIYDSSKVGKNMKCPKCNQAALDKTILDLLHYLFKANFARTAKYHFINDQLGIAIKYSTEGTPNVTIGGATDNLILMTIPISIDRGKVVSVVKDLLKGYVDRFSADTRRKIQSKGKIYNKTPLPPISFIDDKKSAALCIENCIFRG